MKLFPGFLLPLIESSVLLHGADGLDSTLDSIQPHCASVRSVGVWESVRSVGSVGVRECGECEKCGSVGRLGEGVKVVMCELWIL